MGDIIQFPVKKILQQNDLEYDPEKTARLRRIQTALNKINELMRKLKNERND